MQTLKWKLKINKKNNFKIIFQHKLEDKIFEN